MKAILLIFIILISQFSIAQRGNFQQVIESIVNQKDESIDYSDAIANLTDIHKNPIKINSTSKEELEQLFFLTDEQIENILYSHYMSGDYTTPYQLQRVDGLDSLTISKMIPFIDFDESKKKRDYKITTQTLMRATSILETPEGYKSKNTEPPAYNGDKIHSLLRFNGMDNRKNDVGLVVEKDAGEPWIDKNSKTPDYLSGYILTQNKGILRSLLIGDYNLSFGQGLVSGQGMMVGKSGEVLNINSSYRGIKKHSSSTENGYYRGLATTIGTSHQNITLFGSHRLLDAKILIDTILSNNEITTLYSTGLHRTDNEIATKNQLTEITFGAAAKQTFSKSAIEIGAISYRFDQPFSPQTELYQLFSQKPQHGQNYFANYHGYITANFHTFCEVAISEQAKKAITGGCIIKASSSVKLAVQMRSFEKGYFAPRMKAFAESATASGETGIYLGAQIQPWKRGEIATYLDVFKFDWLRYMADAPTNGYEWMIQYRQMLGSTSTIEFKTKENSKQTNYQNVTTRTNQLKEIKSSSYRILLNYAPTENLVLTSRIDFSKTKLPINSESDGVVVSQDFKFTTINKKIAITARGSVFDTDGYESRIYLYEPDLLYSYTSQMFMGRGLRIFTNCSIRISKKITISGRISRTIYQEVESISSGNDEIIGNHKTEAKIQLIVKL